LDFETALDKLGFGVENHLVIPARPDIPFEVDNGLVEKLKKKYFTYI
jgi:hypothetical protein